MKIVFTAAALILVVLVVDWTPVFEGAGRLTPMSLALAATLIILTSSTLALRWHLLVGAAVTQSARASIIQFFAGSFYNLLTPASLGADAYRVLMLRGAAHGIAGPVGVITTERVCGVVGYSATLIICVVASGPAMPSSLRAVASPAGLLIIGLLGLLAISPRTVRWIGKRLPNSVGFMAGALAAGLQHSIARLSLALLLSVLACFIWAAAAFSLAAAIVPVGFLTVTAIAALSEMARWVPLTIQGIGVRESVFAAGFDLAGHEPGVGFLVGAILYGIHGLTLVVVGPLAQLASSTEQR